MRTEKRFSVAGFVGMWMCLAVMAAIVCARRWHTLGDTYAAVTKWVNSSKNGPPGTGTGAAASAAAVAIAEKSATRFTPTASMAVMAMTLPAEVAILRGCDPA